MGKLDARIAAWLIAWMVGTWDAQIAAWLIIFVAIFWETGRAKGCP